MKSVFIFLLCLVPLFAIAASVPVTFTWDAPTTWTDGSALSPSDISSYNFYWGTVSSSYTNTVSGITGTTTTLSFPDNTNTIYAVVTAVATTSTTSLYTDDSYSESNYDNDRTLYSGGQIVRAQSFTSNGGVLNSATFYPSKVGSPTGTATAKIWAHSGVFGISSIPTGSALATSDTVNVSTFGTSDALVAFNFTGANRISLVSGTHYIVGLKYNSGDASNYIQVGHDNSSPTHGGNRITTQDEVTWDPNNTGDMIFSVSTATTSTTTTESAYSNQVSKVAQYLVTPLAGAHTYISPYSAQTVTYGLTSTSTVTADTGYTYSASGCGGALYGTSFITAAIYSACSWTASATINFYSIGGTLSGLVAGSSVALLSNGTDTKTLVSNGTFSFNTKLNYGSAYAVTIPTNPYGHTCIVSNGTGTVTTNDVTTVSAVCTAITYTVTPSAGAGCHINPSTAQSVTVALDNNKTFTFSADPGYAVTSGSGTCGGSLIGSTYIRNIMTADCTVVANCTSLTPSPAGALIFVGQGGLISIGTGSGLLLQ